MPISYAWYCTDNAADPPDSWATNALRFATEKEAGDYGSDLRSRWWAMVNGEVRQTNDEVRHAWVDGELVYLDK